MAFDLEVKPAGYVPKIPGPITHIEKNIYDDQIIYTWDEPDYYGGEQLVYLIKDEDGSIVAATRARKLTITDTNRTDPGVSITALGEDGRTEPVDGNGEHVTTRDMRTINTPLTSDHPPRSTNSGTTSTAPASQILGSIVSPQPITLGTTNTTYNTGFFDLTNDGDMYGSGVLGDVATEAFAKPKQTYARAATVSTKPGSTLSIIAVPLSVALALGVVIAAAIYVRVR